MSQAVHKSEYFAPVDGLRAIAVLSVIAFHFGKLIPAGFVGVDVFFVISGFVVTGAALAAPAGSAGAFLVGFYARRVLRIVPALLVCMLATFLLMVLFVPLGVDGRFTERNVMTGFAALAGLSNFVLAGGASDYWSPAAELNPFTHTWSLAVEEQFYFIAPLLLLAYLRGHRRAAAGVLVALAVASLALASYWVSRDAANRAFYLLPSRFWELAVGVALFMTMSKWRPRLAGLAGAVAGAAGTAMLAVAFMKADSAAFPWPWALLPVFGTALLIASVVAAPSAPMGRLLATRPALWIGKRSYAMYLWHWPLIVIARWTVGDDSQLVLVLALLLTIICAQLSKSLVEDPARRVAQRLQWRSLRVVATGVFGVGLTASAMAGAVVARPWATLSVTGDQSSWNYNAELPAAGCAVQRTVEPFAGGHRITLDPQGCGQPKRGVFVAGDSHAGAYTALLRKLSSEAGVRVVVYSKPGCPVVGLRRPTNAEPAECFRFVDALFDKLREEVRADDTLFLPGLRVQRFVDYAGQVARVVQLDEAQRAAAQAEAESRLTPIASRGVRVIWEAPKPVFKAPPFRCSDWFNKINPACSVGVEIERQLVETLRAPVLKQMKAIASHLNGAQIFDPVPALCDAEKCAAFQDGRPVFFDADHLSGYGNAVLYSSFARFIEKRQ